jgi:hypothetical protein
MTSLRDFSGVVSVVLEIYIRCPVSPWFFSDGSPKDIDTLLLCP